MKKFFETRECRVPAAQFLITLAASCTTLLACSSGGSGVTTGVASLGPNGDGTGTQPLAPPKFEFSPGPPGRAVGVRAIVQVDGVELTSDPVELVLAEPPVADKSAVRRGMSRALGTSASGKLSVLGTAREALTQCPQPGGEVTEMGTINGAVCYMVVTGAIGIFGNQRAVLATTFFAREGIYRMAQAGVGASVPPTFTNATATLSFGCIAGDQPGALGSEYYGNLLSLGFARGVIGPGGFGFQVGNTALFLNGEPQHATQADMSLDFTPIPALLLLPFNVGATVMTTTTLAGPRFVRPWNEHCGDAVTDQNAIEYVRDEITAMQSADGDGLEAELSKQMAGGLQPLFESLGASGAGGLADNVPAASNADYYSQFLSSSGDGGGDAPNTSADALNQRADARFVAAGDDTSAILQAGGQMLDEAATNVPSVVGQATLQRETATGMRAIDEIDGLHVLAASGKKQFIAQGINEISVASGEKAALSLAAAEIAALIGRPVADVNGATVVVNAGAAIENASFTLDGDSLNLDINVTEDGLLVRFDVDLSTADGAFPADVADWVVRPKMDLIRVEAGAAAGVVLSAPTQLPSGGPASLGALVVDANGRRVKRPYSVRIVDAAGQEVGSVNSEGTPALVQYVPRPSAPVVSEVDPGNGTLGSRQGVGIAVVGTGFSRDAGVLVDGQALQSGTDFAVSTPERIILLFPASLPAGSHTLKVVNPQGLASDDVGFNVPGAG